jgi:predicted Rossmann-fold nucleotide-binding protein
MAAMNDGAAAGNGHIVGVIHEMWLVDKNDWGSDDALRDGGAHPVFTNGNISKHGGPHPAFKGPRREMLVAGGKDLQERKRLLVEKADGLIVLPGGPGTWDELWEMACARGIGLSTLPIVCVNVDGYYEAFKQILQRAYDDRLTKMRPCEIVHFENTAEEAVKWIEAVQHKNAPKMTLKARSSALRKSSFLHAPILGKSESVLRRTNTRVNNVEERRSWVGTSTVFIAGLAAGIALARLRTNR